jgi:hypothetical protein
MERTRTGRRNADGRSVYVTAHVFPVRVVQGDDRDRAAHERAQGGNGVHCADAAFNVSKVSTASFTIASR